MQKVINDIIVDASGAHSVSRGEVIQSLWSGYGEIVRYHLQGGDIS
ncbi:MAG: choline kinase, partial [Mariprofundus sp.]